VQSTMQATAAHAINVGLTIRNWLIGYYIVEFEQNGEDRAKYGEGLLQNLEKKLNTKGLNEKRFREYRRLYTVYPQIGEGITNFLPAETISRLSLAESNLSIRRTLSAESENTIRRTLSGELQGSDDDCFKWELPAKILLLKLPYSHLLLISKIENPVKRAFYELESTKGNWSFRELERQINTLYYERSGLSKNKEALSALVNQQTVQLQPKDVINTPVTLEFLGLNQRALVTEIDLEQAILDNLQVFLLEMGHGFCFEARQKRILIDDDYFFVDLLFYHRILKCRVVVELKMDKFRHEYASQLNMYLNYFKHEESTPDDNPPVGILLCTGKGDTQVKYATAGLDQNIFIQKYLVELPDEETLKAYIAKEYHNNYYKTQHAEITQ
jgi:predicted nuclease of restriction endonuclease-like (RecB) superfamily